MVAKPLKVYVIQGRNTRDYSACQAALATVPAHLEALPFLKQEEDIIEHAHEADGLIVSSSAITRRVMSALTNLKVVVRTGVGYDVIDVPAATDLGIVVVNIPDLWVREVANHALGLLLTWNRQMKPTACLINTARGPGAAAMWGRGGAGADRPTPSPRGQS